MVIKLISFNSSEWIAIFVNTPFASRVHLVIRFFFFFQIETHAEVHAHVPIASIRRFYDATNSPNATLEINSMLIAHVWNGIYNISGDES